MSAAVELTEVVKTFGSHTAVNGISLRMRSGSVFGLLGPNGAGKTTTVRLITTLLRPDSGQVRVAGADVVADPEHARRSIGVSGQYAAVDDQLTGYENLYMVARLYGMSRRQSRHAAHELLDRLRLSEAAQKRAATYSGGMRRRLDLAGALVAAPKVVILDEPTTGLDPQSRLDMWEIIGELVRDGATVLLTTQYLEEADQLADHIAVIDHGQVIAQGTGDELKSTTAGHRLEVVTRQESDLAAVRAVLASVGSATPSVQARSRRAEVAVENGQRALATVITELERAGIEVLDLGLRRATLDDVFLAITGDRGRREREASEPRVELTV